MVAAYDASTSCRRTLRAFLVPFALLLVLASATPAFAITRNAVLQRAQVRIDKPVPYSQSKYYKGYRTDCSGYVSMCWATGSSYNTRTFYKVTRRIAVKDLLPGDALLKKGYHIRLFYGWLDEARTTYISYESANGKIAGCRIHSIQDDLDYGYVPVRYVRIAGSPPSGNVLTNPSFDTWARQWSQAPELPMWWQTNAPRWGDPITVRRKSVYRTARNSLQLNNASADPAQVSELSQTATIVPGAKYRLTAWAMSAHDPAGIEVALTYLDGSGRELQRARTTGDVCGVNPSTFAMMSVVLTAPPDAVRARVAVRLAGGSTESTTGPVPGTKVVLDDISLARPQVSVGIRRSHANAYSGTRITVSGTVSPKATVGGPAVVYVKKPGSGWSKLATVTVEPTGAGGSWKRDYTFRRSSPKGTYSFRVHVPPVPDYLGATSASVSVKRR